MQYDPNQPQGGYPPAGSAPQWPQAPQPFSPEQQPTLTPEQMLYWQQYQQGGMQGQLTPEQMLQWQQYQQFSGAPMQQPFVQPTAPPSDFTWQMQQEPPMPGMQPPPMQPPPEPRRPKRKGGFGRLLKVLLPLALAGGVIWYVVTQMTGDTGVNTAVVEMSVLGSSYTGDALIVRNETAYDEEGVQSIEFVAQEGSVVYRGDVICYVYSTGYSTSEMNALQDYRDQIKEYQQTLLGTETAYDQRMTRLENEVVERGLEVRSLVQGARGDMGNQETILAAAITDRQNYFRSKYSSDMRLSRLYDDEEAQQRRIDGWINQEIATQQESIVSFYTDGFEYALTPTTYTDYTPAQVRSMISGVVPETTTAARGRTNLYRLVRQNNYAVLMLVDSATWNPVEGNTYKLVLEQFTDTVVDAQVINFTRSGGELLVRLAVIGDVTDVLYIRSCQAQLGEYVDCMSVPEGALYDRDGVTCVMVINGDQQYFVPVNVLRQEGGRAYISAVQTGYLTQGQTVRLFR